MAKINSSLYIVKSGVATVGEISRLTEKDRDDLRRYADEEQEAIEAEQAAK